MAIAKKKKKKKKDYKIFPSSQISSIIFLKRNVRKEIGHHIFRFCWGPKWLKIATELPAHVGLVQQSPQEHVYMHLGISSYTGQDRQFFKNVNIILFYFLTQRKLSTTFHEHMLLEIPMKCPPVFSSIRIPSKLCFSPMLKWDLWKSSSRKIVT